MSLSSFKRKHLLFVFSNVKNQGLVHVYAEAQLLMIPLFLKSALIT